MNFDICILERGGFKMKKFLTIGVVVILLNSCSINKNVDIGKPNPTTKINRKKEVVEIIENDTSEIIFIEQDYTEIEEESNVVENSLLYPDGNDDDDNTIISTTQVTEAKQVIEEPTPPLIKQNPTIPEPVEVESPQPIESVPPSVEAPPTPVEKPEKVLPESLCANAWYDENQTCDWIHPNLKPTDEIGRSVPTFTTSEDAWNWAEKQMYNETSTWYMCGFNLMDGHTNDGTTFFYGYMKACP